MDFQAADQLADMVSRERETLENELKNQRLLNGLLLLREGKLEADL